jgi:protein-S-isoprenylcysteine O-methyltransferase Ste14
MTRQRATHIHSASIMNLQAPQAAFFIGLCLYTAVRAAYRRKAKASAPSDSSRSTPQDKALILLVVMGQVCVPLAYMFTPWLDPWSYPPLPEAVYLGATLWAMALWLFWRSHADLGNNWSVTLELKQNHQLVQRGVYRHVRHPMYASFLLLGVAQAVLLPNGVAGPSAFIAVALLCVMRIPREEAMLCERFGQDYRRYMQTTGGVMPFLLRRRIA